MLVLIFILYSYSYSYLLIIYLYLPTLTKAFIHPSLIIIRPLLLYVNLATSCHRRVTNQTITSARLNAAQPSATQLSSAQHRHACPGALIGARRVAPRHSVRSLFLPPSLSLSLSLSLAL
ncbi:uncharacterized protein K452DRAFT_93505 [Aplosporella prunicola CBS 121167]|uniref:Uncharacterized protein n=1 Tax=Aplosporella prunicola CBS 121167 TaxID=1176127 RepID=A0A6A6B4U6_9PEZI|nr:uncharacterized protein K452DRAFT_93505 [Aplosporella prunicola CBS 121167]KAF2137987.1 hypothetical protein K452DRAFT_93505 [Aplosporella prunicola CBS 121167]